MCNISHLKFPCKICAKNVHQDKNKVVQCNLCELWIHIKCNNLNYLDCSRYLQNCDESSWYCIECCSTIFPFLSIPYQATKTSWLVVLTLIVTSHSGKI